MCFLYKATLPVIIYICKSLIYNVNANRNSVVGMFVWITGLKFHQTNFLSCFLNTKYVYLKAERFSRIHRNLSKI